MRDHRKLDSFKLADALAIETYRSTVCFPQHERFGLVSQMRRAAVSVPSNIVEGSARRSEKEFVRFLEIAFSSARELGYQLSLAGRLGYLCEEDTNQLANLQGRVCASLAALLKVFRP